MLEAVAANLMHPITPTLIKNANMPSYTFGLVFAAMALGNFLFSPFWGKMSHVFGNIKLIFLGCLGYALGQLIFGLATTVTIATFGRFVSGFFVSAVSVCQLTYLAIETGSESKKYLTILTTGLAVFGTLGFLIGGLLGDQSLLAVIILQVVLLVVCGVLYLLLSVKEEIEKQSITKRQIAKAMNPFTIFVESKELMTQSLIIALLITTFINLGMTAYDQTFNYFIKDQLNFLPSQNGMLKAITGLFSLGINLTLGLWLIKRAKIKRSIQVFLLLLSLLVTGFILFPMPGMIIGVNIAYAMLASLLTPFIQIFVIDIGQKATTSQSEVIGLYNSMRFLGMIIGALIAGLMYELNPYLPFILAVALFMLSMAGTFSRKLHE